MYDMSVIGFSNRIIIIKYGSHAVTSNKFLAKVTKVDIDIIFLWWNGGPTIIFFREFWWHPKRLKKFTLLVSK